MREDFWEFTATFKIVLCSNHRPRIRGTDHAIWRRLRLIPFVVTFSGDRIDNMLEHKLKDELPGILAWCVRGCLEWQAGGIQTPDEVQVATQEYRCSEDIIRRFVADECLRMEPMKVKAADLYAAFGAWCEASGEKPTSQRKFGETISQLEGIERAMSNGTWYRGIGLKSDSAGIG